MDKLHALESALEKIVLDPKYHDILTLVKGVRNGIVYGAKVRFPHALVMIFLFRSGTLRSKCTLVYKATRQHARNLGLFALVYKTTMLFLRHTSPTGKERHYDSFLAGLLGGYTVFGRTIHNSVSQQIVIYVFARVCLALAKLAVQPRHVAGTPGGGGGWELFGDGEMRRSLVRNGWPAFASLSWAMVMYLFRWYPESVQSSLRSSMSYMWIFPILWLGRFANEEQLCAVRSLGLPTDVDMAQQMSVAVRRWALSEDVHTTGRVLDRARIGIGESVYLTQERNMVTTIKAVTKQELI